MTGVWPDGAQASVVVMSTSEAVATAQGRQLLASDYPPGARVVAVEEQAGALA